ncbi:hypothetical protein KBC31_00555 [Candidatus Saccharibacteria bacterium]|nr:hypothetical protein [Candidatus Saccharibacteria bacterium]
METITEQHETGAKLRATLSSMMLDARFNRIFNSLNGATCAGTDSGDSVDRPSGTFPSLLLLVGGEGVTVVPTVEGDVRRIPLSELTADYILSIDHHPAGTLAICDGTVSQYDGLAKVLYGMDVVSLRNESGLYDETIKRFLENKGE